MDRRRWLGQAAKTAGTVAAWAALAPVLGGMPRTTWGSTALATFEVTKTPEEWRKILTPEQFAVLREHSTERSGTSPLNHEKRAGTYSCAGCALPLYDSATKFDSGTGWPSFYDHLPQAIGTSTDYKLVWPRTEVHCRRCGGHLGHVFDDGPPPTRKRYCMNGVALVFTPRG